MASSLYTIFIKDMNNERFALKIFNHIQSNYIPDNVDSAVCLPPHVEIDQYRFNVKSNLEKDFD